MLRLQITSNHALKLTARLSLATIHVLIFTIIAWQLLRFYPGDRWVLVRLAGYFAPWLFLGLGPGLVIALIARQYRVAVVCAGLMFVMAGQFGFLPQPPLQPAQADSELAGQTLKVMTFNANFRNRNAAGIAEMLRQESPDLVAFQEMKAPIFEPLRAEIEADYPYILIDESSFLPLVLASRYPLTAQPKPAEAIRAQHAAVELPSGPVDIWNVHPNTAIASGWESQRELLAIVAAEIAHHPGPVIVLGDFNTTPQSENYWLVARHLIDVHHEVGRGFGFSFADLRMALNPQQPWAIRALLHLPPLVRIDHILVSHHFTPQQASVLPASFGSDHRPVVAVVRY